MRILTTALLANAAAATIEFGKDCDKTAATEIVLKVNMYSSEWGMYEVEGCDGVGPKLHLKAGTTYKWRQSDISNWCGPPPAPS